MGHTSCAHAGQGLLLWISIGRRERPSRRQTTTFDLAIVLGRLSVQSGVALVAELFGRLVIQRTVRTHRVVFAPEPSSFLLGVLVVLELLSLQELVAKAAVERLADSVFPGAPRRHGDRLGTLSRQPTGQGLADELRSVVATDAPRRPSSADHPRQHRANVLPGHRAGDVQGQALLGVLVHQCQPPKRLATSRAVGHKVIRPNVVLEPSRPVLAAVGAAAVLGAELVRPPAADRPLEVRLAPQPADALEVYRPPFAL